MWNAFVHLIFDRKKRHTYLAAYTFSSSCVYIVCGVDSAGAGHEEGFPNRRRERKMVLIITYQTYIATREPTQA